MSATEILQERVKQLDEEQATKVLALLDQMPPKTSKPAGERVSGMDKALGYAKKYNHPYKTTAEWMKVLREGEQP